jgi:methyl-accepting chemotaxis protein
MNFFPWFSQLPARLKHSSTAWRDVLPEMAKRLDFLAGSTEGEFLAIGEKLQDFYTRTTELSEACSAVATHLSGKELETVIEGFGKVVEAVNSLENGSRRNTDYLQTVLEKLDSLNSVAEGFQKTILLLRVLCVSIRIESARLGDMNHGFETLAEEVQKLSVEIESRSTNVHTSCQSLRVMIEQTLSRVLSLEAARQKQAGIVLEKTMSGLEALLEKHSQSAGAAQQISARFETVSKRIGDIVQSMQFHDITRQRIEHAR